MHRKTNRPLLIVILIAIVLSTVACYTSSSPNTEESSKVDQQQAVYSKNQPVPAFDWSLERDVLTQLFYARNDALSTYTVVTDSHGDTVYQCSSIGFPIAADTQLTNPEKVEIGYTYSTLYAVTLPQAEPNGLYNSNNFGTWVLCVMEDGTVYPYYTEQSANTWPFPVVKDPATGEWVQAEGSKPSKTLDLTNPNAAPAPVSTWTAVP